MEQVVQEAMESFNEYIGKIPNGVQYIADLLRNNEVENARLVINDFAEGIDWLIHVNRMLDENGISLEIAHKKLQSFLLEINGAILQGDYVLVADLFEYELKPFFESMKGYTI